VVGLVAYAAFITGTFGSLARVIWVIGSSPDSIGTFTQSLLGLGAETGFLVRIGSTLWDDRAAFWLLVSGLVIGYCLSWLSDRNLRRYFSGFWHRTRPMLRSALRRTPATQPAVVEYPREVAAV
jgi:hypothetical protein